MKLVIIAGGKGTRLGYADIPKPMVQVCGKPILQHQIELAKKYGINDIYILSGYLAQPITDYFGDGSNFNVKITHFIEDTPMGTAGAIKLIENQLKERFLVFYGDVIMDFDIKSFINFDKEKNGIASIIIHPNDHPYDSDLVEIDNDSMVTAFHPKPHPDDQFYRNCVNAAVYILSPDIFKFISTEISSDFGKNIFPAVLEEKQAIFAYNTPEYIKDMGTPDRLEKVEKDLESGKIARKNIANKQKAIFLDRDGVLNEEVDNLRSADQLKLLPGISEAIKKINQSDYLAVIITNQPVIAKGFTTEEELQKIHNKLEHILGKDHSFIDRIYHCPHHPEKGFPGEIPELKIDCQCRKPNTGMIDQAVTDLNIDISKSFFIGDTTTDIQTGINAGLKTILLKTGYAGKDKKFDCTPDYNFNNCHEAVDFILKKFD